MRVFLNKISKIIGWIGVAALWQMLSFSLNNPILFPSLISIFSEIKKILLTLESYLNIFITLKILFEGSIISFLLGSILAVLSFRFKIIKILIEPFVSIIKALPTVATILIIIIWFRIEVVPLWVGVLIAIGMVFDSVYAGILAVDKNILYMAKSYKVPVLQRIFEIYIPSVYFSISGIIHSVVSLIFKVIIASEILAQMDVGIGSQIFYYKNQLESASFFAWILISLVISLIIEICIKKINRNYLTLGGKYENS